MNHKHKSSVNILTIDFEEWFHILDHKSTKTLEDWKQYPSRIEQNGNAIIDFLVSHEQKATFFCLGWIAEKYPELVRKIHDHGFEIGSHTYSHQLLFDQDRQQCRQDIIRSIQVLQDCIGEKVRYFRAPGFSLTEETKWVFDILIEQGIEIDCSIFPTPRAHGGFPSFISAQPSVVHYKGNQIKELPMSYVKMFGQRVVFSGGGYFRLLPYAFIKYATKKSPYVMAYLHPRDFDPDQPMIQDLSRIRKFKSYIGLRTALKKFDHWLQDFDFVDIREADKNMINWDNVPQVTL